MHWLLTRPQGHNRWLADQLRHLGHSVTIAPTLAIGACDDAHSARAWEQLENVDALLFSSVNAVEYFAAGLRRLQLSWPDRPHFAIGSTTAKLLAQQGRQATAPVNDFTSEALLAMPQLQSLVGQQLLLVSGRGGRGLLQPSLEQRGVTVTRLDVYYRYCNPQLAWPSTPVDGVLVTSLESWHCLLEKAQHNLQDSVVIAGSERIGRETAKTAATRVAASPRDEDMLAALQEECP